jgi:hypothetical protein
VLRMDRLVEYGPFPAAAGIGALVAWVIAGAAVATSSGTRTETEHSSTPVGSQPPPDHDQLDPEPGSPGADR